MKIANIIKSAVAVAAFAVICTVSGVIAQADNVYQDVKVIAATDTSVTISWEEPENYSKTIIGYGTTQAECKKMLDSKKLYKESGLKTHVLTGLKPGTKYYVSISYKETFGEGIVPFVVDSEVITNPGQVKGVKLNEWSAGLKKATVLWTEQSAAAGYEYKLKDASGKVVESGDAKGPYAVTFDVKNDRVYSLTVRAYANRDDDKVANSGDEKKIYGKWSKEAYLVPMPEVKKGSASSSGLKFSWQKVAGATNYTIYASTSAKKGFKKIATTKNTSYTIKKLDGKINTEKNYYVYVIANKKSGSTTIKSQNLFKTKIYGPLFVQVEF